MRIQRAPNGKFNVIHNGEILEICATAEDAHQVCAADYTDGLSGFDALTLPQVSNMEPKLFKEGNEDV